MEYPAIFDSMELASPESGRGERARLFPVLSENSKEGRAASIFLACLSNIPAFANQVLSPLGRPIGARSKVQCFAEMAFKGVADRPDGLIVVSSGKSDWLALVEFKVGGSLDANQVERYLKIANENPIDALITVSNDIVPHPTHCPVKVDGRLTKRTKLFHVSWMQVFTYANLLISQNAVDDAEQGMILREFARFLVHPSTGIKGFEKMPSGWPELVSKIRSNRAIRRLDSDVLDVVTGWMQEEVELAFILSRNTSSECSVRRPRPVADDGRAIHELHAGSLLSDGRLATSLSVPHTAAPIDVNLNLASRSYDISMSVKAPMDKSRPLTSFNWLLRQLSKTKSDEYLIFARWAGRSPNTDAVLKDLRADPEIALSKTAKGVPVGFTVCINRALQSRFESRKAIIDALESDIALFYTDVGQHLKAWVPPAPKSREKTAVQELVEESNIGNPQDEVAGASEVVE